MRPLLFILLTGSLHAADFRIERSIVLTSTGAYHWSQSRAAVIPGDPARVIITTTQEFEKSGLHGYRDIYVTETTDGAKLWSTPQRIDSLGRKMSPLGVEMVMGDLCPQWHEATKTVLVTGKTFGFKIYLICTRRGAGNDHVFRHRAPLFIAQVDPEKLHVIRATEQVLMPETGVDLGGGYAPVDVTANETWVISTEMAFPKGREDESNRVLLAKILWNKPN